FTLSHGSLVGKPMGRAASPAQAVALHCTGPECPEVDALVGGAAVQAEVQVLVVSIFYRVHYFFWHPHSKGQVSPHLPDHNGCSDVRVGPVAVSAVLGAIGERCRQLVCLCVIHLLVHTLLEVLEDDWVSLCFGIKNTSSLCNADPSTPPPQCHISALPQHRGGQSKRPQKTWV
uniref:Uncharacterized protein n=1 Tax=Salmo trutta TaxID=8032 RepID=A0A674D486_SALTR